MTTPVFFKDLALDTLLKGFVALQHTSGWLPMAIVSSLHRKNTLVHWDDADHCDAVQRVFTHRQACSCTDDVSNRSCYYTSIMSPA
jgi:hypothetical protein